MIETHDGFWDCECEHDYIHPKSQPYCSKCHTNHESQPDSIVSELKAQGFIK